MRRMVGVVLALLVVGFAIQARQRQGDPVARVPGATAREAIDAAAAALGGADRILQLRNVTLIGYAQYAYQNGGGNISPLPGAPQKFIAANDYRRIYDLEHGRMLHQERRNDLFPFANYGGHDFALQRQVLDGDIAYNINAQGQAARGGDARDRRMWMHTNPVVAVRAALDPANTSEQPAQENGLTLVDVKLKEGDVLTIGDSSALESAGIRPLGRPAGQSRRGGLHHALLRLRDASRASSCRWATRRASTGDRKSSR